MKLDSVDVELRKDERQPSWARILKENNKKRQVIRNKTSAQSLEILRIQFKFS